MVRIATIVEGDGEVEAVPILIRRIATRVAPEAVPELPPPIRVGRMKLMRTGVLERAVELAARRGGESGRILVLIDADRDCPRELAPRILQRAASARRDRRIRVVLAKAEYEAWFLAAVDSIAGYRGIRSDAKPPEDPESIRDAKGWLTHCMPSRHRYSPVPDQAALTATFDLDRARAAAPSFDKLWRDVGDLLR